MIAEDIDRAPVLVRRAGRLPTAGLAASMMLGSLGVSLPYVVLPTLTEAFGVSLQAVQWIVTGYLLSVTALVIGAGRLGDVLGHRKVLLAGLSLFLAASVICAVAPSFWILIVGRVLQGAGAAALMALTLVLARQIVAKDAVGRVMGLLGTMSAIGTALGPSLGGVLTAQFGWRAIFLGLVALSAVSIALVAIALPASDPEKDRDRGGFDIVGTVLLALSVSVYALALSGASGSRFNFGLFLLALLGAGLFVLVELRTARPLVDLHMLRDAGLSSGLGSNMLVSTVIMATLVVGPFYLSMALDLSATAVGFIVSVGPVIAALSGVPAGRMVDKFGSGAILAAGLTQVLGACIGLALLPRSMGIVGYIVAIAVLTSGYQLFLAANNTAIMVGAREDRKGVISGLLTLSRNLGLSTGAALMGGIFASLIQGSGMANPEAVARGMNATFAFAAVLIVIALVVTIWTRRNLRDRPVSGQPAG